MKESAIQTIAKKLNVSPSMVSRVLNHCSGVDSDMRHRILEEADRIGAIAPGEGSVYVILPDIPRFFWEPMRQGVAEALTKAELSFKVNICTKVGDEAAILQYLSEAERMDVSVIILATYTTPAIRERLERLVEGRLILFLSEYSELTNTFYTGSDSFNDGYLMGQYYVSHYADHALILLPFTDHRNYEQRIEGFRAAVEKERPEIMEKAIHLNFDRDILSNFKLIPSKFAPLLEKAARDLDKICIYSPAGIQQLSLAILKAKIAARTVLLCQDCYTTEKTTGLIVSCNQDTFAQGRAAGELAVDFLRKGFYPENKKTFIPSQVKTVSEKP